MKQRIADIRKAKPGQVRTIEAAKPNDDDGRGPWLIVTLANGDVLCAFYPQGDTCELINNGPQ